MVIFSSTNSDIFYIANDLFLTPKPVRAMFHQLYIHTFSQRFRVTPRARFDAFTLRTAYSNQETSGDARFARRAVSTRGTRRVARRTHFLVLRTIVISTNWTFGHAPADREELCWVYCRYENEYFFGLRRGRGRSNRANVTRKQKVI
jgi:hypothetical protein